MLQTITNHSRRHVVASLHDTLFIESLFDRMPDVVFSVKDVHGRYVAMSEACVSRCGLRHKHEAIGKTAFDLFPRQMASRYAAQDADLFHRGKPVVDRLDLTLYNDRQHGWCLSNKLTIYGQGGDVLGLICISKDLTELTRERLVDARFAATVDHIQAHYDQVLCLQTLADVAGMSVAQLDRRMKRVFQLSTGEFVRRTRLEAAIHMLLHTEQSIAQIAADCGFFDQSAFSRQCRAVSGMCPSRLRQVAREG
jgi:AraC-like DNA-binding protein